MAVTPRVSIQPAGVMTQTVSAAPSIAPRLKVESPSDASGGVSCIRTSKEWVLPPRPKPGRKPSTETPPTKRKAQNRAAQRAFRERRAARVVELEERLQELESEKEEKEADLTTTLQRISSENQQLKSVTEELKQQLELFKQFQAQQAAFAAVAAATGQQMPGMLQPQTAHHLVSPAPSPVNEPTYSQDMLDRALEERLPVNKPSISPASTTHSASTSPASYQYQSASPSSAYQSVTIRRPLKISRQNSVVSPQTTVSSPHSVASPILYNAHKPPFSHAANPPSPLHNVERDEHENGSKEDSGGCGLCNRDGNCLCSDLGIKTATDVFPREQSPEPNPVRPSKHIRTDVGDDLEMDFTHAFQSAPLPKSMPDAQQHQSSGKSVQIRQPERQNEYIYSNATDFTTAFSSQSDMKTNARVIDPCGFCSNDTPCICADAAEAEANADNDLQSMQHSLTHDDMSTTLPPLRNDPHSTVIQQSNQNKLMALHPEPINDVSASAVKAPPGFAPGTCDMCQRDPMQTLFCTSLASKKSSGGGCGNCSQPGGCCGGSGGNSASKDGAFIPCSAAYQTLSRHKGFKAVELPSLVGKLSTKGGQVEVSSVASVLRELDRRLYN
ncbi:hypothetical protein V1512DRAFT_256666 [Lipomyces arxii]|uniref:uncharacterized protein n=1 Tax=Lipomyces arxii TaxID=56418 RepID=UPI0034CF7E2E